MCGIDGSAPPTCLTVMPFVMLGPINKSADKNWLEALASISSAPPGISPVPFKVNGKL